MRGTGTVGTGLMTRTSGRVRGGGTGRFWFAIGSGMKPYVSRPVKLKILKFPQWEIPIMLSERLENMI
jgi:hypothetical protein